MQVKIENKLKINECCSDILALRDNEFIIQYVAKYSPEFVRISVKSLLEEKMGEKKENESNYKSHVQREKGKIRKLLENMERHLDLEYIIPTDLFDIIEKYLICDNIGDIAASCAQNTQFGMKEFQETPYDFECSEDLSYECGFDLKYQFLIDCSKMFDGYFKHYQSFPDPEIRIYIGTITFSFDDNVDSSAKKYYDIVIAHPIISSYTFHTSTHSVFDGEQYNLCLKKHKNGQCMRRKLCISFITEWE